MDAFARIFEGYRRKIYAIAYRLVGPDTCDDVVMETYLKAWRAIPKFRGSSSVSTWLCRITKNCALDFLRKSSRRDKYHVTRRDPDDSSVIERVADTRTRSPEEQARIHELSELIHSSLDKLGEKHRTVLLLREADGLSYREIAAAVGVSMGTVMSRLYHARRKMRSILEADDRWHA